MRRSKVSEKKHDVADDDDREDEELDWSHQVCIYFLFDQSQVDSEVKVEQCDVFLSWHMEVFLKFFFSFLRL